MNVLLFDIDGTLLSSGGAGKAAMEAALAQCFGLSEVNQKILYAGRTDRAIMHDLMSRHGINPSATHLRLLIDAYLERLPAYLATHEGRILPGIANLLQEVTRVGAAITGLLTGNLQAGARLKLGYFGLWRHFACGGFGDEHLDRNDVAREALAVLQSRFAGRIVPDRIWVIGDTPLDIACARAIGARAAAVATGGHSLDELADKKPDLLLSDLMDPVPLLQQLA